MDYLTAGSPTVVTFVFRDTPIFPDAPEYEVINESDVVLLSGVCSISGSTPNGWDVNITIPTNYSTTDGDERIIIEIFGNDSNGNVRSTEKVFTLLDATEEYTPYGIIVREGYDIEDSIVLDAPNYTTNLTVELVDSLGNSLFASTSLTATKIQRIQPRDGIPDRLASPKFQDYKYTFTIPTKDVVFPIRTYGAHQLNYTLKSGNKLVKFESHPVYRVNHYWIKHLNSLRMYLDKARLTEIDAALEWRDDELCQSLLEGAQYINGFPDILTYWTIEDFPETLHQTLWLSAAYHALNTRYLAEGFTAFEFSGLSTSLTVDRREAIVYKIDEIKGFLDNNLAKIKKLAVQTAGTGTSSTGETSNSTGRALGVLGTTRSPAMNSYKRYPYPYGRY